MLISPLLLWFISVSVVAIVLLLFVPFSVSGSPELGSPAVEKISLVVISPLLVMLTLPPSPKRENDSRVPELVSIVPSALRVISPPLPLPF